MLWAAVAAAGSLAAAEVARGGGAGAAALVRALVAAVLPAAGLHLLLGAPDGGLSERWRRSCVAIGYRVALVVGLALFVSRPGLPLSPVWLEAAAALAVGLPGAAARYERARGEQRWRLQLLALALLACLVV